MIIARITKRAQIPFSRWLPAAISAPTPISSLVHSSTLVTAGIYIFTYLFYNYINIYSNIIIYLSCITILISFLISLHELDMKKIIALSTLNQMSFIIIICIFINEHIIINYIIAHAWIKSFIFICAGFIIMYSYSYQNILFINVLWLEIPIISSLFILSLITIQGIINSVLFLYKHFLVDIFIFNYNYNIIKFLFLFAIVSTLIYIFRLSFLLNSHSCHKSIVNYKCNIYWIYIFKCFILIFVINNFLYLYCDYFIYKYVFSSFLICYINLLIIIIILFIRFIIYKNIIIWYWYKYILYYFNLRLITLLFLLYWNWIPFYENIQFSSQYFFKKFN